MAEFQVVCEGLSFPEGPVVMGDGSVIVVELAAGRISRCWDGRSEVISRPGGGPNGAAIGPDGALYVCNNGGLDHLGFTEAGRIERIDLTTGSVERVYESYEGVPLSAPNDLIFDAEGNLWFTDFGRLRHDGKSFGGLYCARPDGREITRIRGGALSYNGIGISPDMLTVYVADTYSARVYSFDRRIEPQESRVAATVVGPLLVDSLAMTAAGNICLATLNPGGVATISPGGQIHLISCEDERVTNIAFGGADMCDAWLTYSGRGQLVKARWREPGLKLVYNS